MKRLYRSRTNKVIAGVCGGLGKYLDIDPTILRILFLASIFLGGAGFILYIIAWIVVPEEPLKPQKPQAEAVDVKVEEVKGTNANTAETETSDKPSQTNLKLLFAAILVIVGILLILGSAFPFVFSWAFSLKTIFGILLVIIGGILLMNFLKEGEK